MKPSATILSAANAWLDPFFDSLTQIEVQHLMQSSLEELEDAFYKNLEFGTGGMRGIMGVGDNRLNTYTLGKATQGLSNYLKNVFKEETIKVAIAYDCRNQSKEFAKVVADVFSANGIRVYLFAELRPTPELSFAIRTLECQCGIVLTASHNPPEYNGYKVYWQDGGQIVPPQDSEIMAAIVEVAYQDVKFDERAELITFLGQELDDLYLEAILHQVPSLVSKETKKALKIVFTSLHGTSITVVPKLLAKAGFSNVEIVEEQAEPNGNFPTVRSPNPEEIDSLKMALDLAEKTNADLVIGTDPDCDRLGVAIRNNKGELVLLNGNEAMVLMSSFLLDNLKNKGKINKKQFIASTIVSTPLMKRVASHYGVQYKECLTGFKWIAKMINDFPGLDFVCGGEESFGFLIGDIVRDKDAVSATLLMCEMAAKAMEQESSIYTELLKLFKTLGCYQEKLFYVTKKGKRGLLEINEIMRKFRENPLTEIYGSKVVVINDYLHSTSYHTQKETTKLLELPKSDVLIFKTQDGTTVSIRPSGTEPKLKFYVSVQSKLPATEMYDKIEKALNFKLTAILTELSGLCS
jgi:phosphoglucomutase